MQQFKGAFTLIALVLAFTLGMASLLNFFKFEHTVRNLQYERIQTVAKELDDAIQKNLTYSTSLGDSSALERLTSQTLLADPLILSADIFGQDGAILFTSDAYRKSLSLPKSWQAVAERSHRSGWLAQESDVFVAGRTVRNSFGVRVATVVLRYQRNEYDAMASRVSWSMTRAGIMTFGGCLLTAVLVLVLLMKFQRKSTA